MSVLIIDDEIDLSLLLKSYFVRKGYEVELSHSLSEGLQQLEQQPPDILFLDNNFPDGLGWEEAPSIVNRFPDLQLFLISAYHPMVPAMPSDAHFKVLEKPISFSDLDKLFAAGRTPTEASTENL